MQKRIAISLIFLLFLSQTGYYFYYSAQREGIRNEMAEELQAGVPENSQQLIIADENAISWQEQGKELYFEGNLYDVAKLSRHNGKIYLYCINDYREQGVLQELSKSVKAGTDTGNDGKTAKHDLKFQLSDYTVQAIEKTDLPISKQQRWYHGIDVAICSTSAKVNIPPPRA